jgi:two-component system sensor histidine kinase RegB
MPFFATVTEATQAPGALPPVEGGKAPERLAGRQNLLQLTQLRWLAVAGQLATIVTVQFLLGLDLPLRQMLWLLAALVVFNLACGLRARAAREIGHSELFAGLLVDVLVLSGQLYFSGGIANPFIFLFLLQVAVAAVLLKTRHIWAMVALTSLCFIALTQWHRPLRLPEPSDDSTLSVHYIGGLLVCFAISAALLVIFIGRIGSNLRQRDARLADLRQRAAEEEHIVRMGLLATGAAHELGTPLATLSVILGDWARMAPFVGEPELREEIEDMQTQLRRCKSIVSGILLSAGEARGESPVLTSLHAFLDELVADWRATRPGTLRYDRGDTPDLVIVSDTALRQMVGNVLDNALEAAPQTVLSLSAGCEDDHLVLRVRDQGAGFSAEMLAHFGQPYQSTKGKPGGGLGLFLSVNVARMLGGQIVASNLGEGGAEVVMSLPLAALTMQERSRHGRR